MMNRWEQYTESRESCQQKWEEYEKYMIEHFNEMIFEAGHIIAIPVLDIFKFLSDINDFNSLGCLV